MLSQPGGLFFLFVFCSKWNKPFGREAYSFHDLLYPDRISTLSQLEYMREASSKSATDLHSSHPKFDNFSRKKSFKFVAFLWSSSRLLKQLLFTILSSFVVAFQHVILPNFSIHRAIISASLISVEFLFSFLI